MHANVFFMSLLWLSMLWFVVGGGIVACLCLLFFPLCACGGCCLDAGCRSRFNVRCWVHVFVCCALFVIGAIVGVAADAVVVGATVVVVAAVVVMFGVGCVVVGVVVVADCLLLLLLLLLLVLTLLSLLLSMLLLRLLVLYCS